MHYAELRLRPSVWGTIRWPKALGKPIGLPPERGFAVAYHGGGGSLPGREGWPGHVQHPCLTFGESSGDDYLVTFWGPNVVDLRAEYHAITVHFAPGVAWEALPKGYYARLIEPQVQQFVPDSVSELETVGIWSPWYVIDEARSFRG